MRERQRTGTGGGSLETQAPFSSAAFKLPLTNTLAPIGGYGPATFTRSTTATFFDNEGILKEVRAGAARFTGARRVANLLTYSEDFTNSAWIKSDVTYSSGKMWETATTSTHVIRQPSTASAGTVLSGFVEAKAAEVTKIAVGYNNQSGVSRYRINIDLLTGNWSYVSGSGSAFVTSLGDGWYRISITTTLQSGDTLGAVVVYALDNSYGISYLGDPSKGLFLRLAQSENVTDQSDQTPSEYVSYGTTPPNLLTYTEDLTNSVYTNTNITVEQNSIANPIDGRVNATKLTVSTTAAATFYQLHGSGYNLSNGATYTVYVKKGSGATDCKFFGLRNFTTSTHILLIDFNYDTGVCSYVIGSSGASATDVGNGWWRLTLSSATGFAATDQAMVYLGHRSAAETAGQYAYIYGPQVTIGTTTTAYYPIGAAYDPHGSGVDGVKYFTTNKDLTSISPSVLKGYLTEGAATNNLLWNRDLTNAAWTKSNMTTALTATGIDGQANAASVLTATAGNATCLQPRTLASAVRSFSAFVRRKIGTGTISITRDGGTTWTDITLLLNTASYVRVSIENSTVLNPSCGFKITTSGDAIDVDYCQDEAGYVFSNPILTTTATATRNQDFLSYPVAGNVDGATGSVSASWGVNTPASTLAEAQIAISRGTNGRFLYLLNGQSSRRVYTYDSTNFTTSVGITRNTPVVARASVGWSGSTMSLIAEGAASVSSTAFDGSFGTELSIYIGGIGTATWPLYGNVKNVYFWSGRLTDTQLKQAANA